MVVKLFIQLSLICVDSLSVQEQNVFDCQMQPKYAMQRRYH